MLRPRCGILVFSWLPTSENRIEEWLPLVLNPYHLNPRVIAMRLRGLALSLALALPQALCGQTAVMRAHLDRDAGEPTTSPASLFVLDAKGTRTLFNGFTSLLQTEELRPYQVPMRGYATGSGVGRDLISKYHLSAKAQWLLIDKQSSFVVAQGEEIPDAQSFAAYLHKAGFHDLVKELRAYLKEFPTSLEAHEQLLHQLRQRGERAAQRFMGIQIETHRERLDRGDFAGFMHAEATIEKVDLAKAKALDPIQDLEAWAAFAQELETVFRSGEWREIHLPWVQDGRALDAASPTLRVLYHRWQPTVEEALQRNPASESFWDLWIWMSQAQGGRPLAPLLGALKPTPLVSDPWPPVRAVQTLFSVATTQDDWRTLESLYQTQWNTESHPLREAAPTHTTANRALQNSGQEAQTALLDQDWTTYLGPLLECCLRSGDTSQADALFIQAMDASRWMALPGKGAELAKRCHQTALAARWGALRPTDSR